jgi:hypothetical protein
MENTLRESTEMAEKAIIALFGTTFESGLHEDLLNGMNIGDFIEKNYADSVKKSAIDVEQLTTKDAGIDNITYQTDYAPRTP